MSRKSRPSPRSLTRPSQSDPDLAPLDHPDADTRYAEYEERYGTDDARDDFAENRRRRGRTPLDTGRRLVGEGRSGRVEIDIDRADPNSYGSSGGRVEHDGHESEGGPADARSPLSSYDVAEHGPVPVPDWLVTDLDARDTPLGVVKTGKEADVHLLDRSVPAGPGCLLAVKIYRTAEHRMFHRDAGYLEGRRTRRSREMRAMAKRTRFGRDLMSGQWAAAEFSALARVWQRGGRVPYPVQLIGSELMMEFIGDPDGTAAARLADHDTDTAGFTDLWHDLVATLEVIAENGLTHGDLSPFNILATDAGCVVIDMPQVVNLVVNPQGIDYLERDCARAATFFTRRGVLAADADALTQHLWTVATGSDRRPPPAVMPLPPVISDDDE